MLELPDKIQYKIGEVAKAFRVNTSKIRYWEKEFDIINPKKNKKGDRIFSKTDIIHLKTVYELTQERGMTLEGAKKELANRGKELVENQKLKMHLEYVKQTLLKIRNNL